MNAPPRLGHLTAAATALFLLASPVSLAAQGVLGRLAKGAVAVATEIAMTDAVPIDLEQRGLATLQVGPLTLGVSGVEVADSVGIRVQAYLYNPGEEAVSIPLLGPGLFVLVDERGRRAELIAGPKVEKLPRKAKEITVPPLERVGISILFAAPEPDAREGILKLGALGVIRGLPVHASDAGPGGMAPPAEPNVYVFSDSSVSVIPPSPPPPSPAAPGDADPVASPREAVSPERPSQTTTARPKEPGAKAGPRGAVPLVNTWVYQTLSFKNEDGSMSDASQDVWGALQFRGDGTYKQHLRIGDFNNIYYGRYRVVGDEIHLTRHDPDGTTEVDELRFGQSGVWLSLTHGTGRIGELTAYYGLQLGGSCDEKGNCARVPSDFLTTP